MYQLITTTSDLEAVCLRLHEEPYVTVDTEFIREKTYYPKLCLVQIAGVQDNIIIDPLADDIDLTPLLDLMADEKVLKIFHAAQQDVEIFYKLSGKIPSPIFDTQIAAMVCGFGESVGYEALVNRLLNETLDKASRYTDWEQRPLTNRQLNYAIADVTHLRQIYEHLHSHIVKRERQGWIAEELAKLNETSQYHVDPEEIWRRLKYKNRSPAYLNILRAAAAWRERTSQLKNIPRGRMLKDEVIVQIASMNPHNMDELAEVRGAMKHLNIDNAQSLIDALEKARATPKEDYPRDEKKRRQLEPEQEGLVDVLKMLLKMQCDQHEVASKLVANKEDIAALVLGRTDVPCMHGWRYTVFGEKAERFLSGALLLKAHKGTIQFEECSV